MTIMACLIPIIMIGFGAHFMKTAPKNINFIFGYRTSMSMKNQETWIFAHNYCGKIWLISGIVSLMLSAIIMILVLGKDTDTVGYVGAGCMVFPIVLIIFSIILTEKALNKNFDKNGNKQ